MNFFQRLRAAYRFTRFMPYVEAADHEDFWGTEDALAYGHFMNSATGQKLKMRCANLIVQSAVNATQANNNPVHRNGWACGVAATFNWLDQHLVATERHEYVQDELINKFQS